MPDAPPPLDLDAIEAAIAVCRTYNFGMYQADRLAHEHAPALVAEVKRLRAEVTRLHALVADLRATASPAWDEHAAVEGMARAVYPFLFTDDRRPPRGQARSDAELREGERDVARERMRQAVAVVRDHQPVKPGREAVIEAMLGSDIITDDLRAEASAQGTTQREPFLCFADAVLDLLPGRSEAEVKAEALREAAETLSPHWEDVAPAAVADLERRNPYRGPSACGCDLTGMAPPAVHIVDNHEGGAS